MGPEAPVQVRNETPILSTRRIDGMSSFGDCGGPEGLGQNPTGCLLPYPFFELIHSEKKVLDRVWNVVAGLPGRQRHIFYLRFVRDMELSEIAVDTGLKINVIKSHLHRALGTVRVRIGTAYLQCDAHL